MKHVPFKEQNLRQKEVHKTIILQMEQSIRHQDKHMSQPK